MSPRFKIRGLAIGHLLVGSLFATITLSASPARADDASIRIGVLNDQSGPYADYQGPGSVLAAQMAVEDYGGKAAGRKIDVISADHQNKVDIGTNIARKWFESEGVDAICRQRRPHRRQMLAQHDPLDL
jgi:hypothetical protein